MSDRDQPIKLSDDLKTSLIKVCDEIDKEDEDAYNELIRVCVELEQFWKGNQYLFWDGTTYRTARQTNEPDYDEFERIVNIYKAHGESVIAALAMEVPNVVFYPADADSPDDISTAETYTKLSRIVAQENRAPLVLVRALSILFNGGLIAGYNYHERSEKYGFIEVEETEYEKVPSVIALCPNCSAQLQSPDPQNCPECGQPVQPNVTQEMIERPLRSEMKQYPKGKEKLRVWGPPFIKVPMYVNNQDEAGYVRLSYELTIGLARSRYTESGVEIKAVSNPDDFAYDQRMSLLYGFSEPRNLVTVKMYWIRPYYFHVLDDSDVAKQLVKKFPNGCFATVINQKVVECFDESIDQHWTLSENPLYSYIWADPLGKCLKPVQDKRNEEDRLVTETLRHGIPFTLADAEALDWDKFRKTTVRPGDIFPAKAPFGKSLQDGFHTVKTATVPQEITQIAGRTDEAGQFVVGSFPSIYGGPSEGGSRTYAEYAMSRNQALQRLSIHWKVIVDFWTRMMEKAVTSRVSNLDEDEQYVDKASDGFVNIFIRKANLTGKIGHVVSESSERLPLSWLQKKDQLMELLNLGLPEINQVIFHPENANLIAQLFGFPELYIPGSDQRLKQLAEIKELVAAEPMQPSQEEIQMAMQQGQAPQMRSTVPVEPDIDDHGVHSFTCGAYLVGQAGLLLQKENPGAYQNIVLHKQEHDMILQQQMMQQQQQQPQQQPEEQENAQA